MYKGIIHTSMHEELPKNKEVTGINPEPYELGKRLNWLEVTLASGMHRHVLVSSLEEVNGHVNSNKSDVHAEVAGRESHRGEGANGTLDEVFRRDGGTLPPF